jgi:hypothetical protein
MAIEVKMARIAMSFLMVKVFVMVFEIVIAAPVFMKAGLVSMIDIMNFIAAVFENNMAILGFRITDFELMIAIIESIIAIMNSKMPIIESIMAIMKTMIVIMISLFP